MAVKDLGEGDREAEGSCFSERVGTVVPHIMLGCLLRGRRALLANIRLDSNIHPSPLECTDSFDGLGERGFKKLIFS